MRPAERSIRSAILELQGILGNETEAILIVQSFWKAEKIPSRSELMLRANDPFPAEWMSKAIDMAERRRAGFTLQYLTGFQTFLDHDYQIVEGVLVPRPETEFLVSRCIEIIEKQNFSVTSGLEIGVGTGVISIELLSRFKNLKMTASDVSETALDCASRNVKKILGQSSDRLNLLKTTSLLTPLEVFGDLRVGFIVSNPPYLSPSDPIAQDVLDHEPHEALFPVSGDPLYFYREIAHHGRSRMLESGWVAMELAPERADDVLKLFLQSGWRADLERDLTGRKRILIAYG